MVEEYLDVRDLHKSFGDFKAVNGVSFTIHKGEIFGLLGPNGAGKTTTIRMLSTVLDPDSGEIFIGGHLVAKESETVRSLIGVCPQELALYEDLSAFDNIASPLEAHRLDKSAVRSSHQTAVDSRTLIGSASPRRPPRSTSTSC